MTPNISPEREAELRAWLVRFDADPKNDNIPSWTRDVLAMLDHARSDANYFNNLTKMQLQALIQQEPEGVDAASDVFDRVIDCFRRLKRERDAAVAALTEEQQCGSNTCLEWSDVLTETLQCLADACPLGWIAAQDMNEAQAWEKRAAALILKHGTKEVP